MSFQRGVLERPAAPLPAASSAVAPLSDAVFRSSSVQMTTAIEPVNYLLYGGRSLFRLCYFWT